MAKKREVNFFIKIDSDEDLEKLLQVKSLIILDVYQDLFGPCTSLHGCLENVKLMLQDSSQLQLAVCDSGKVEKLKRFRFKCQPTLLFCDEGRIVDIVYGANIPRLVAKVKDHLAARDANTQRVFYDFDEPLPFEQVGLDIIKAKEEEKARILKEKAETELYEKLDQVIALMEENAKDTGVTIFMPHVAKIALKSTTQAARNLMLHVRARKLVELTPDMYATLNYKLDNPIEDEVMSYLSGKEVLAVLWLETDFRKRVEEVLCQFVDEVSQPTTVQIFSDDNEPLRTSIVPRILDPLTVYLDGVEDSISERSLNDSERESVKSRDSQNSNKESNKSTHTKSSEPRDTKHSVVLPDTLVDERPKIVIPPIWTPKNQIGNFMFMFTLFRSEFNSFLPSDKEPEAPHVCMIFAASKRYVFAEVKEEYKKDLLAFGFFTSGDLQDCKLICKSAAKYEELEMKETDRIIAKVSKQTSRLELALSSLGVLYVSQNTTQGAKECSLVFNEAFEEAQDEMDKKPEEKNFKK